MAQLDRLLSPFGVPEPDRSIVEVEGNQAMTIGSEAHVPDPRFMPPQLEMKAPGRNVPDPDHPVPASRYQASSVRMESDPVDLAAMAAERLAADTRGRVPEPDPACQCSPGQQFAVGTVGDVGEELARVDLPLDLSRR